MKIYDDLFFFHSTNQYVPKLYTLPTMIKAIKYCLNLLLLMMAINSVSAETPAPTNDDWINANQIANITNYCSTSSEFTNIGASTDGPQPTAFTWSQNVWFKFTPTTTGQAYILMKRGSIQFGRMALYKLVNGALEEVMSKSYHARYGKNWLHATGLDQNAEYYLGVDNLSGSSYDGSFGICIRDTPNYDFADQAVGIDSLMNTCSPNNYSTLEASGDGPAASNIPAPYSNVWFKFTATNSEIANIVVKRGGIRFIQLSLFEKNQQGDLVEVMSKSYHSQYGKNWLHASGLVNGVTYYLSVDNLVYSNTQGGSFSICLKDYNDFDSWEFAENANTLINSCSGSGTYSTLNATGDGPKPDNHNNYPYNNVWFKFTATTDFMKVVANGMQYMQLAIFEEVNGSLVHRASRDSYARFGKNWLIVDDLIQGNEYFISVGSIAFSASMGGDFTICLVDTPDHDFKDNAVELVLTNYEYNPTNVSFDSKLMSGDGVKPTNWSTQPFANSWFKFDLEFGGDLTINIDKGSVEYIRAALYDAAGNELLSDQASRWGSLSFPDVTLAAGEYHLSVGNIALAHKTGGVFSINLSHSPDIQCTTELWAIASGDWDDPNTWSATEGGQPVSAIPCETTVVYIKGFDVSFNSSGIETAKRVEIIGTNVNVVTQLDIQTGQLNVKEKVVTSGAGAKLRNASGARVKVTGQ